MPRTALPAALSVLLLSAAVAAPVPSALRERNLIVNGSFEDGPKCDRLITLPEGSTDLTGWTITRGTVDVMGTFWGHADGKRSVDLHGSPGFGGMKQTVKLTAGARYTLSFCLSASPHAPSPKKKMAVEVDGDKTEFEVDATGRGKMEWERHTLSFTAGEKGTVIEFFTLETDDANNGPAIDDVKLVRAK